MNTGATCFLGSIGNAPPASIVWSISGYCYIRGMGFEYDFGPDGSYAFWALTLPEARQRGLFTALLMENDRYGLKQGYKRKYVVIEFDNKLAYDIQIKAGYKPILVNYYIKIFSLKFIYIIDLRAGNSSFKVFMISPPE